ncbi:MAG: cupin domain-containing protein [Agriterribacter sp.]
MNTENTVSERVETINAIGSGQIIQLEPGVICEALVGKHNGAVNLFTAIVTFDEGVALSAHSHPHAESITLLQGNACIDVEDRRYFMHPKDNITIPAGYSHVVKNISSEEKAVFHIAMPVSVPQRTPVEKKYATYTDIPHDFNGTTGAEYIVRYQIAKQYNAGSATAFTDFFNEEMIPGVGMSGGFGLFYQGGRLPAHFHDFDESICIVTGEAICVTRRNRYTLSNMATALQPQGLPHYFINTTPEPMTMIWVYAGAMPIRTEVQDF